MVTIFRKNPYAVIYRQLPASYRSNQAAPFCSFDVPAGWRDLSPAECSVLSNLAQYPVVAGVTTERLPTTNFVVVNRGTVDNNEWQGMLAEPDRFLKLRLQVTGGRPKARPTVVVIGGHQGILLHILTKLPGERFGQGGMVDCIQSEVYVRVGERIFFLSMGGLEEFQEESLPAFWTMLGTLQWAVG